MAVTALAQLSALLSADWHALREQDQITRRDGGSRCQAPGGGRKAKLDLADRVLATVLQQHLALPPSVLAHLFTVSKDTIRQATTQTTKLMDQHGHTPGPPAAHLSTLAGLRVYADTHGIAPATEIKSAS